LKVFAKKFFNLLLSTSSAQTDPPKSRPLFLLFSVRAMPAPTPAASAAFAQKMLCKNPIATLDVVVHTFF
jgi:hypothetical protein